MEATERILEAHGMKRRHSARSATFDDTLPEVGEDEPILIAPEVSADAPREDA